MKSATRAGGLRAEWAREAKSLQCGAPTAQW